MIWGIISFQGTMELQGVSNTAASYIGMLERPSSLTEHPCSCRNDWIFQQDNAAIHNARSAKDFFIANNMFLLDHPAWTSTENVWAGWQGKSIEMEIKSKQCMIFVKPSSPLGIAFQASLLQTLISTMPKWIFCYSQWRPCYSLLKSRWVFPTLFTTFYVWAWTFDQLLFSPIPQHSNLLH